MILLNSFSLRLKAVYFVLPEQPPPFPVSIFGILYDVLLDPAEQSALTYANNLADFSSPIINSAIYFYRHMQHLLRLTEYSLRLVRLPVNHQLVTLLS